MNIPVIIVGALTLMSIGICAIVNNSQCLMLKTLISWLRDTVKAALITNGEPAKARALTLTEVPKYEVYLNESINYGMINIVGLLLAISFLCSGIWQDTVNIFLAVLACLLFVMNVVFLPRAWTRHAEITDVIEKYEALVQTVKAAQVQPLKVDG